MDVPIDVHLYSNGHQRCTNFTRNILNSYNDTRQKLTSAGKMIQLSRRPVPPRSWYQLSLANYRCTVGAVLDEIRA